MWVTLETSPHETYPSLFPMKTLLADRTQAISRVLQCWKRGAVTKAGQKENGRGDKAILGLGSYHQKTWAQIRPTADGYSAQLGEKRPTNFHLHRSLGGLRELNYEANEFKTPPPTLLIYRV